MGVHENATSIVCFASSFHHKLLDNILILDSHSIAYTYRLLSLQLLLLPYPTLILELYATSPWMHMVN
ncbi:hypothetical protein L2E82_06693 [Cichorium intybus]|uniref:Uncharacterized protein n=1 Tax=Cichorium intybus TaxID=13427 RepID=A0ACB9HAR7_CICIN|nr:hypothetical protein L2E82_06693 [Cichorium intybus]